MFTSETFKIISISTITDLIGDDVDLDFISFGDADYTLLKLTTFLDYLEFEKSSIIWDALKDALKITGDILPSDVEDIYVNLES
jgi:hypothetical protein